MDDILNSYLETADEMAEVFSDVSADLADGADPRRYVDEVFRGVHSLKGTAGFLKEEDPRLEKFEKLCHLFESIMDDIRKSPASITEESVGLMEHGLNVMVENINLLCNGEEPDAGAETLEEYRNNGMPPVPGGNGGNNPLSFLNILYSQGMVTAVVKSHIKTTRDSLDFTEALHEACSGVGSSWELEVDLQGHRLSSIGVGAILSARVKVSRITVLNAPRIMQVYFRQFGFSQAGINVNSDITAGRERAHA